MGDAEPFACHVIQEVAVQLPGRGEGRRMDDDVDVFPAVLAQIGDGAIDLFVGSEITARVSSEPNSAANFSTRSRSFSPW